MMKALEKDRRRRYETASDFAEDISKYLSGDTVSARPASTAYRISKFVNKNKGLVASLSAISILMIAAVIVSGAFASIASQRATDALRQKRRANNEKKEAERLRDVANTKTAEANKQRNLADEKSLELKQEKERAQESEDAATFQLANARWEQN